MSATLPASAVSGHHLLPQKSSGQAKVPDPILRKTQNWRELAEAVDFVRRDHQLSIKEFAAALKREESQVRAWLEARERPQIETVHACERFKSSLVVGLAKYSGGDGVEVETTITVRRRA